MRTLVVGANGLLGSNVVAEAVDRGWDVQGTVRAADVTAPVPLSALDIRDGERTADLLDEQSPEIVVNCAAMTDVDGCERDPERAHEVNGQAPGALASACSDRGIAFVHVSTDYVFSGQERTPYAESDEPNPVQAYGESKLAGERAVGESSAASLVVRLSFVYGTHGFTGDLEGFLSWVRDRLSDGQSVPLFVDQHVTPTRAGGAAAVLLDLADRRAHGTFHAASRTCTTPFEFGRLVADRMNAPSTLVEEGSLAGVDRDAQRPEHSCLDVSKLEATLDRLQPTVGEDLTAIEGALDAND